MEIFIGLIVYLFLLLILAIDIVAVYRFIRKHTKKKNKDDNKNKLN